MGGWGVIMGTPFIDFLSRFTPFRTVFRCFLGGKTQFDIPVDHINFELFHYSIIQIVPFN